MPRPSLRRTRSTPVVRARANSNPYPTPSSYLSSQQATAIFSSAPRIPGSSSALPPVFSRRVNSSSSSPSSSSMLMESEYSHSFSSSSDPESPTTNGGFRTRSRRVLADITWWFDGQLCSMEEEVPAGVGEDGGLEAEALFLGENGMEMSDSALSTDWNEGFGSPETMSIAYPPSPTSSTTSSSSRLSMVLEEANISSIPWTLSSPPSLKSRREASFSSISSSDLEFEDVVPSAAFV